MLYRPIRTLTAIATLLIASQAALADRNAATSREWNVETDTFTTALPEVVPSPMAARSCVSCASVALQVTKDTQLLLGETPTSLREMRQAAQKKHFMMVFYAPTTSVVTRIVIYGVAPSAK